MVSSKPKNTRIVTIKECNFMYYNRQFVNKIISEWNRGAFALLFAIDEDRSVRDEFMKYVIFSRRKYRQFAQSRNTKEMNEEAY